MDTLLTSSASITNLMTMHNDKKNFALIIPTNIVTLGERVQRRLVLQIVFLTLSSRHMNSKVTDLINNKLK